MHEGPKWLAKGCARYCISKHPGKYPNVDTSEFWRQRARAHGTLWSVRTHMFGWCFSWLAGTNLANLSHRWSVGRYLRHTADTTLKETPLVSVRMFLCASVEEWWTLNEWKVRSPNTSETSVSRALPQGFFHHSWTHMLKDTHAQSRVVFQVWTLWAWLQCHNVIRNWWTKNAHEQYIDWKRNKPY